MQKLFSGGFEPPSQSGAAPVAYAMPSSNCYMKCPQCEAWISLLATVLPPSALPVGFMGMSSSRTDSMAAADIVGKEPYPSSRPSPDTSTNVPAVPVPTIYSNNRGGGEGSMSLNNTNSSIGRVPKNKRSTSVTSGSGLAPVKTMPSVISQSDSEDSQSPANGTFNGSGPGLNVPTSRVPAADKMRLKGVFKSQNLLLPDATTIPGTPPRAAPLVSQRQSDADAVAEALLEYGHQAQPNPLLPTFISAKAAKANRNAAAAAASGGLLPRRESLLSSDRRQSKLFSFAQTVSPTDSETRNPTSSTEGGLTAIAADAEFRPLDRKTSQTVLGGGFRWTSMHSQRSITGEDAVSGRVSVGMDKRPPDVIEMSVASASGGAPPEELQESRVRRPTAPSVDLIPVGDSATPTVSTGDHVNQPLVTHTMPLSYKLRQNFKKLKNFLSRQPALDDTNIILQLTDVLYVIASVYLCCFALFLLNAPSRPWLITWQTGGLALAAQITTVIWTILRFFVRNRDTNGSFVVNDTVGDTTRKYFLCWAFWIDLLCSLPLEWLVLPMLVEREKYLWKWWGTNTTAASQAISVPGVLAWPGKAGWERTAEVFTVFMMRNIVRYVRLVSLVRCSNPIVSERALFRLLLAISIAVSAISICAVVFQSVEGPMIAAFVTADSSSTKVYYTGSIADANFTANLPPQGNVNNGFITTPSLLATFDALYWSFTTALAVGYGDITPRSAYGRGVAIITMLTGTAVLSTMTAIATRFFATKDPVQQELEERKRKMTSMLEFFEVPWELQRDVIASFPAVMEAHSRTAFLDMLNYLPEICRVRVEGYSRLRLLRRIQLFEGIEREYAFLLAKCLTQRFVAARDLVVKQGEPGSEMYFVVHGMLDVVVQLPGDLFEPGEQLVVTTLRDGSFFGEKGLLDRSPRAASVVAITLTELLVLTRADFEAVLSSIPSVMDLFRRNVFKQQFSEVPPEVTIELVVDEPPKRAASPVRSASSPRAASPTRPPSRQPTPPPTSVVE